MHHGKARIRAVTKSFRQTVYSQIGGEHAHTYTPTPGAQLARELAGEQQ